MTSIKYAVFPVAGMGTRFLPATKATAKEMLPVVDKPLIQYAVEEAIAAGITELVFVTGRHKRAIEDYFDAAPELELELEKKNKLQLLALVKNIIPEGVNCIFVRQSMSLGLGHAVLCARPVVGSQPFALLLADDLMVGATPITRQLLQAYDQYGGSVVAIQDVPLSQTNSYGIVAGPNVNNCVIQVTQIVEKPDPTKAPSTLAVAGRYVLSGAIFELLDKAECGVGGEIQLTDAIAALAAQEKVFALRYGGRRYDCGSKLGLLQANVDFGEQHPEIGQAFSHWIRTRHSLNCTEMGSLPT